ncbi:MAG: hypothetical protein P4L69_20800 [Desulfosporosinus sp.]|nr:hypothetical protein [Desulfosporosinus sp.]
MSSQKYVYIGLGVVAVVAVVAAIVVIAKKENPAMLAKTKVEGMIDTVRKTAYGGVKKSQMAARAVDWDATASMWEDEDADYRRAAAMDMKSRM